MDVYPSHLRIAGGAEEVHKSPIARRILKGYRPHEGNFPREFIPYKKEQAWEKMQPVFASKPELATTADNWTQYLDKPRQSTRSTARRHPRLRDDQRTRHSGRDPQSLSAVPLSPGAHEGRGA